MSGPSIIVGVDVGGTFTDVLALDTATGSITTAKVPSSRPDQSRGFAQGVRAAVTGLADVATIVHGTTVGTNALLERRGARTGIITTQGFRDVLAMRRRDRPATWGLRGGFTPVVARADRLEVAERTLADGSVLVPVEPGEVAARARDLLAAGCEALCVFFINGHAGSANEQAAAEAARAVWPTPFVTAATEIGPEIREFERLSTAALNAYLQPAVSGYLDRLQGALGEGGFEGNILIVQSNGGVMAVDTARRFPVRTALSGPAAGVIAATRIAAAAGFPDIVTGDVGGTSFDVSLVAGGEPALAAQTAIDFGLVIRSPMIEITTIGAGGGSIAGVDASGLLFVGPQSAGSDPGPVAYGLGNDRPTVTDANLVLGRINPDRPIGGLARLDVEAARRALDTHVGAPLGLTTEAAAEAVVRVANAKMAAAIRLVSIERGHDPARFAAVPFGGGGGLHVGALIEEVGLKAALVPRFPGITSALGCVMADLRQDRVRTVNRALAETDPAWLADAIETEAEAAESVLTGSGTSFERVEQTVELDMLYQGQTHFVSVPVTHAELTPHGLIAAFERRYRESYGRLLIGVPVRLVNVRIAVIGRRPRLDLALFAPRGGEPATACRTATRRVHSSGTWHDAGVYERLRLAIGERIEGPALLEQPDATVFVDLGLAATVDAYGNLVIRRMGAR